MPKGKTMSLHKLCSRQREYYRVDAFPNLGVEARLPLRNTLMAHSYNRLSLFSFFLTLTPKYLSIS